MSQRRHGRDETAWPCRWNDRCVKRQPCSILVAGKGFLCLSIARHVRRKPSASRERRWSIFSSASPISIPSAANPAATGSGKCNGESATCGSERTPGAKPTVQRVRRLCRHARQPRSGLPLHAELALRSEIWNLASRSACARSPGLGSDRLPAFERQVGAPAAVGKTPFELSGKKKGNCARIAGRPACANRPPCGDTL